MPIAAWSPTDAALVFFLLSAGCLVWSLLALLRLRPDADGPRLGIAALVVAGMVGRATLSNAQHTHEQLFTGPTALLGSGGEAVLPMLVEATMPAVLVGLYIAIVLSAIMSTVDSLLVVAASAVVRDGQGPNRRVSPIAGGGLPGTGRG